jgi:mannose-6-phosphate isomerase-like protein (cupin superfamily)
MSLNRKAADIPVGTVEMGDGAAFTTTLVHGLTVSLMVAERPGGYHSSPHTHDCEQLNVLQDGALSVFCDGEAYELERGDALRIPAGAVHWSWNRSTASCTLVEVHAPGLQEDPEIAPFAVDLLGPGEAVRLGDGPVNRPVVLDAARSAAIEAATPARAAAGAVGHRKRGPA